MGACGYAPKRLHSHYPKSPTCLNTTITQGEFYPPPNLLRKSSNSPLIKERKELFQCVSGMELNSILAQGGNIESNLSLLFARELMKPEYINHTNIQLLLLIANEINHLSSFSNQELIGKVLDDYILQVFEKFGDLIKELEQWNKADISFCTAILFQATEIYQVLLSFKKKNRRKKMNYWWLPPLVNFSDFYDEADNYTFLRKKIDLLEGNLKILFTSTLGIHTESTVLKGESLNIEISEKHQAAKCAEYKISKTPVVKPHHL